LLRGLLGALVFLVQTSNPRKYGDWAVVTGATDGIGFAYAERFASKGMNVVLISRSTKKLSEKQAQLQSQYPKVQIRTVTADFCEGPALYTRIAAELRDVPVGILVNNVGMSYPHAEFFQNLDSKLIDDLIAINVTATTNMTRIVLPAMIERRRGCIVMISSAAGVLPTGNPLYAVYSATKAYVDAFAKSLHYELASKNIHVQCQIPFFVVSNMSKIRKSSVGTPSPDRWVTSAVNAIGHGASVVPYWFHALQYTVLRLLPRAALAKYLVGLHVGIRQRALKKKGRSGEETVKSSSKI